MGAGVMVNVAAMLAAPSGFRTVTLAVPVVTTYDAGMVAVI